MCSPDSDKHNGWNSNINLSSCKNLPLLFSILQREMGACQLPWDVPRLPWWISIDNVETYIVKWTFTVTLFHLHDCLSWKWQEGNLAGKQEQRIKECLFERGKAFHHSRMGNSICFPLVTSSLCECDGMARRVFSALHLSGRRLCQKHFLSEGPSSYSHIRDFPHPRAQGPTEPLRDDVLSLFRGH